MSASEVAAAAAREAQQEADAAILPDTLQEPRSPERGDGSLPAAVAGSSPAATPSMAELLSYLMKQNDRLNAVMEMMAHDRKSPATNEKNHLANCKLDEKYFRTVGKFNNLKSGWKEWRRQFLNAVRECDVDWADMVETLEKLEDPIDHITAYNVTQNQLSTNLYNRLISYTSGVAFQIVESVPNHNGGEAW